jgi:hypothetical protein
MLFRMICLLAAAESAVACDLCNCYFTVSPDEMRHTIGLRYRYSVYHHNASVGGSLSKAFHSTGGRESYHTIELWGRWHVNSSWYIEGSLPYRSIHIAETGSKGAGDVTLLAFHEIWRVAPRGSQSWGGRWLMGAGMQAPTGRSIDRAGDPDAFPGSGTWNGILSEQVMFRRGAFGFSHSVVANVTLVPARHYRPAHSISYSGNAFLQKSVSSSLWIVPSAGFRFETAGRDRLDDVPLSGTGGRLLSGQLGLDTYIGHLQIHSALYAPIHQKWNDDAPQNEYRVSIGLSWMFDRSSPIQPLFNM